MTIKRWHDELIQPGQIWEVVNGAHSEIGNRFIIWGPKSRIDGLFPIWINNSISYIGIYYIYRYCKLIVE